MFILKSFLTSVAIVFALAPMARADDAAAGPPEPESAHEATAEQIAEWIVQLESNRFSERQQASHNLTEAGASAVPALEVAAKNDMGIETSVRAIAILTELHRGDVEEASTALGRLAEGDSSVAAAAEAILEDQPTEEATPVVPRAGFIPGGVIRAFRLHTTIVEETEGGRRTITIEQNEEGRSVQVEEEDRSVEVTRLADDSVRVEVTAEDDMGVEVTETYEADSAEELEEENPEAYEIYEEFSSHLEGAAGAVTVRLIFSAPGGLNPADIEGLLPEGFDPENLLPRGIDLEGIEVPGLPEGLELEDLLPEGIDIQGLIRQALEQNQEAEE